TNMSNTLYATFSSPEAAEKAAGALLDHGVQPEDLSVVRKHSEGFTPITAPTATASNVLLENQSPIGGSVYGTEPIIERDEDMGVDDQIATEYGDAIEEGGAILAVSVPSGQVEEAEVSAILSKYAATNVNRYEARTYVA